MVVPELPTATAVPAALVAWPSSAAISASVVSAATAARWVAAAAVGASTAGATAAGCDGGAAFGTVYAIGGLGDPNNIAICRTAGDGGAATVLGV